MGMPIGGVGQVPNQAPTVSPTDIQHLQRTFQEGAKVLDSELQAVSKEMIGKKSENATTARDAKEVQQAKQMPQPKEAEALASQMAQAATDVKNKKKTKFDEMMEQLQLLEETLDLEQLSPEQKAEFQNLFENLSRVKKRQKKMRELEEEALLLEDALEKQEKEKGAAHGQEKN